jgi:hypothetical protein
MKGKKFLLVLVVAVLLGAAIGGATFGIQKLVSNNSGGTTTPQIQIPTQTTTPATTPSATATNTSPAQGNIPGVSGTSLSGTVTAVSAGVMTVLKDDGASVSVDAASASIQKLASLSLADLAAGMSITVSGDTQDDGSILATAITVNQGTGGSAMPPAPDMTVPQASGMPTITGVPDGTMTSPVFTMTSMPTMTGQFPGGIQQPGSRGTSGTIEAINGSAISLKTQDGTIVTVVLGEGATIQQTSQGNLDDIVTGCAVSVSGMEQEDGSVTAVSVTVS